MVTVNCAICVRVSVIIISILLYVGHGYIINCAVCVRVSVIIISILL